MILNLTQHKATKEQLEAGVVDLTKDDMEEVSACLNFNTLPEEWELEGCAGHIVCVAKDYGHLQGIKTVMIGGAPWFMSTLELALKRAGFAVVYAFSVRESVESMGPEGEVVKTSVFKHKGFIRA